MLEVKVPQLPWHLPGPSSWRETVTHLGRPFGTRVFTSTEDFGRCMAELLVIDVPSRDAYNLRGCYE